MTALERKVGNMLYEFVNSHPGNYPEYIETTIRWSDNDEYMDEYIFQIGGDLERGLNDENVFYVLDSISDIWDILANIDFTADEFNCRSDFYDEVNKYDDGDESGEIPDEADYVLYSNNHEFCIVDVKRVW